MQEILRSLRTENNYSQSAVANYLNISRQMYNKYENGLAEPSLKNIKKLCELYKVSADVFFESIKSNDISSASYPYDSENDSNMYLSSPTIAYGEAEKQTDTNNILNQLLNLLPLLRLNEQISLMSRLASIIEKETCTPEKPLLKTKKIKKIPDALYNSYLNTSELQKIRTTSLANIREILKNDEW